MQFVETMDLQYNKICPVSPSTTHCSELEYLIELNSEEIFGSQLRRSQRLRAKEQAVHAPKDVTKITTNNTVTDGGGSPQLFVETDEEFSPMGQMPPHQASTSKNTLNQVPQSVASKRATEEEEDMDEGPKKKRHRRSGSQIRSRSRSRKRPEAIKKPTTLSSKLKRKSKPIKKQLSSMASHPKMDKVDCQHFNKQQTITISSNSNLSVFEISPLTGNPSTECQNLVCNQTSQISLKSIVSDSGIKRGRPRKQPEAVQKSSTVPTEPQLTIPSHANVETPKVEQVMSWQNTAQQPQVIPPDPKPPSLITNANPSCSYQRMHFTQTLLSERYPAHFIHQLPPESNSMTGNILPTEFQRIVPGTALPVLIKNAPASELRQMCPTPDTTPTAAHESYSPSPPNADSMISTTPSLSDSLAEVFGTKKIRNILNIEPPRKYLVLEVHLPAIAFMLDVELSRLRAVLGMTQRLTLEQMQQMAQESREVISIHSSSDDEEML